LTRHRDLAALALIGLVAALLRLAFLYRAPVFLSGDSQSHYLPGFDLAHGLSFEPELRRPPGYALFVAGVITLLGEDLRALAFAQHLLGTVTALLTYALGRLTFGPAAGLVAGLLVALDGALILSEHSVMTEALFGTLLVAALVALLLGVRASRRPLESGRDARAPSRAHWIWCLLGGLLLGLASLTRPVAQILLPLVPLALLLIGRRWRPALLGSAIVGLGFLLVLGPWMIRNLAEHGSLTASGGLGRSLVARTIKYDFGFFEDDRPAEPDDLTGQVRQFIRGKRNTIRNSRSVRSTQAGLMKELGLTQAQSDGLMRRVALAEIAERPFYYALGSLRMAGQIALGRDKEDALAPRWNDRADKDWVEQWAARIEHLVTPTAPAEQHELERADALVRIYQPATLGPLVPLLAAVGLAAAVALAPFRPALLPGLAAVALILASAALDGPVPRYRYPVDPLLALLAAGGVLASIQLSAVSYRRWAERRTRRASSPAAESMRRAELTADS
jgi:4-amino-4-deoxy-L-arabinose transferase-like glycosyltransferase